MEANPSCQNFGKRAYQPEVITKHACKTLVMDFDKSGGKFWKRNMAKAQL